MRLKMLERKLRNTWLLMKLKRFAMQLGGKEPWTRPDCSVPSRRYGDWEVATQYLDTNSIVYSFGVGDDIAFDLGLIDAFGVSVFAFDPTPLTVDYARQRQTDGFRFLPWGIADFDGKITFYQRSESGAGAVMFSTVKQPGQKGDEVQAEVYRLQTIMGMLGHQNIDLLKMDIEGGEYDVIRDMLESGIRPKQVCVEVHHRFFEAGKARTENMVTALRAAGYKVHFISGLGREYTFIFTG